MEVSHRQQALHLPLQPIMRQRRLTARAVTVAARVRHQMIFPTVRAVVAMRPQQRRAAGQQRIDHLPGMSAERRLREEPQRRSDHPRHRQARSVRRRRRAASSILSPHTSAPFCRERRHDVRTAAGFSEDQSWRLMAAAMMTLAAVPSHPEASAPAPPAPRSHADSPPSSQSSHAPSAS